MRYRDMVARMEAAGVDSPAFDVGCLLEQLCGVRPPFPGDTDYTAPGLGEALERRAAREPLQYILGEWSFWRQTYRVAPGCLIPRADTELLVDFAAKRLPRGGRLLDLCTGSGCIAVSTLAERPDCVGEAVDLFDVPLTLALENAVRNGVADRLTVRRGDVLVGEGADGGYDIILSNPPYIVRDVVPTLAPELAHEPVTALDGGDDGLDFYRAIVAHYRTNLAPGGCFVLEIGYDQADALRALAAEAGMRCTIHRDLGGCDRMAILCEQEA